MDRTDPHALVRRADGVLADLGKLRAETAAQIRTSTDEVVTQTLRSAPLDSLWPYLPRGARIGGLGNSQFRTVADLLAVPARILTQVPGVDIGVAQTVQAAAQAQADHIRASVRLQLHPERDTALLSNLLSLTQADAPAKQLRHQLPRLRSRTATTGAAPDPADAKVAELIVRIDDARHPDDNPWAAYRLHPGPVEQLMNELSSGTTDVDAEHGFVGAEITAAAEQIDLDTSLLHTELRGYQHFGAQYALAQQRVLLCDEMGLGKTLQSLAVAAHIAATDKQRHVLVVCPANVGLHWVAEAARHTALTPIEVRGKLRDERLTEWKDHGGIAVVSFPVLQRIKLPQRPDLVIVDEAHLLRDPKSDRTRAVRNVLTSDTRVLFLSGVSMHNRIDGFRNLVDLLQPDVAGKISPDAGRRGPVAFRRAVGRVYLRRYFNEVSNELPQRISTQEWLRFTGADRDRYRRAVGSGNFTAIRQAAWPSGAREPSAKLDRLLELTAEAHLNGTKVVVFSQFRLVLETIRKTLTGNVFGPLDETVPDPQAMVDEFATHPGPATLLAQIDAGALDLRKVNAPVVLIVTEPHWRPRTERRVIGRTQRISELHTVRVHRLLTRSSIDEPLRRLPTAKDATPPHQDTLVRAEQERLAR